MRHSGDRKTVADLRAVATWPDGLVLNIHNHFLRPGSIAAQVEFFLKVAAPDNTALLALDHEDERVALIDAKELLLRVEDAIGRKPVLYSGFLRPVTPRN